MLRSLSTTSSFGLAQDAPSTPSLTRSAHHQVIQPKVGDSSNDRETDVKSEQQLHHVHYDHHEPIRSNVSQTYYQEATGSQRNQPFEGSMDNKYVDYYDHLHADEVIKSLEGNPWDGDDQYQDHHPFLNHEQSWEVSEHLRESWSYDHDHHQQFSGLHNTFEEVEREQEEQNLYQENGYFFPGIYEQNVSPGSYLSLQPSDFHNDAHHMNNILSQGTFNSTPIHRGRTPVDLDVIEQELLRHVSQSREHETRGTDELVTSHLKLKDALEEDEEYKEVTPTKPKSKKRKIVPEDKLKPKHVGRACVHCKKAHLACDHGRPCKRCVRLGKDDCIDVEHKKRGRPTRSGSEEKLESHHREKGLSLPDLDHAHFAAAAEAV